MRLHAHDGYDVSVGEDQATFAEDRSATFQRFINEVPAEFDFLATVEAPYRIPAPGNAAVFQPGGAHAGYFTGYAASVGVSATTQEVTGCSGPLREDPARCSAINRHVAQLPQSQWSDPSLFYKAALRTTTRSSGTTTRSATSPTGSRTTTTPGAPPSSRTATRSTSCSPSAGNRRLR